MDNKHEEIFYNTDNNNNLSSSPTFLGRQINPDSHQALSSDIFDIPFNDENFDLLEMLSNRDYYFPTNTSIFEVTGAPSTVVQPSALQPQPEPFVPAPALGLTSRIINTPEIPDNSSSSNETVIEEQVTKRIGNDGEEDKVEDKNKKLLMPKNMSTKKKKEPRFVFMMETDIDNMDDGYKWRKYGQKAVKNSPFPRNYYRCSSAGCSVTKRVERSPEFPSTVITTYEGTHNHVCPMNAPRGSMGNYSKSYGFLGSSSNVGGGTDGGNLSSGSIGDGIVGGGGEDRAKLSSGIGGNFNNGISVGGSIGGKFSSPSCGIGGGIAGSFSGGASGGIVGSFGSASGGSLSTDIGGASGSIGGRFSSGGDGSSYGLDGRNFSIGIRGTSGGIGGNFSSNSGGGGSFSSGFGSIFKGDIVDDISSISGMIMNNAYNVSAIDGGADSGGGGIGGSAISGGASDINRPYTVTQLASHEQYRQHNQYQPYL